jgi:hypothetical protein
VPWEGKIRVTLAGFIYAGFSSPDALYGLGEDTFVWEFYLPLLGRKRKGRVPFLYSLFLSAFNSK